MKKLVIDEFDKLSIQDQEEIQDFIAGYTPDFEIIENNGLIYFVDGAGFNGQLSKICIAKSYADYDFTYFTDNYTNNEIEYLAIIKCMQKRDFKKNSIIYSDSLLCVNQLNGKYKVKNERLIHYYDIAKKLKDSKNATIEWISREKNIAGKLLEK